MVVSKRRRPHQNWLEGDSVLTTDKNMSHTNMAAGHRITGTQSIDTVHSVQEKAQASTMSHGWLNAVQCRARSRDAEGVQRPPAVYAQTP